jgi:uncharacterized oligopeptide transporter (OPT) family protein
VVDPQLRTIYPYLLCIAFGGIFALLGLRTLLIVKWRLPFPSGTASGSMINSLHSSALAAAPVSAAPADPAAPPASTAAAAVPLPGAHWAAVESCSPGSTSHLVPPLGDCPQVSDGSRGPGTAADADSRGSSAADLAAKKVRVLAYTALGSFLFDAFKW